MSKQKLTPENEPQIIASVMNGDKQAWDIIVAQFYDPILNFITNMVRDREAAEELIQDVFVNFWAKREKIQITSSLKAYLYRAARNHTLNFIKRRKFEQDYHKGLALTLTRHHNATEDDYHFSELEKKLNQAIADLPENCKEIFMLSRFEEMTYKEIAEALDVPVRTVHYQIGLALKELREKLKGHASPGLISMLILVFWLAEMLKNI